MQIKVAKAINVVIHAKNLTKDLMQLEPPRNLYKAPYKTNTPSTDTTMAKNSVGGLKVVIHKYTINASDKQAAMREY